MATTPTNNSIPSESPRDLKFNAGKIDEIVNSPEESYSDRFGKGRLTWAGIENITTQSILSYGFVLVDSFQDGADITSRNQALRDETTGLYFRWNGDLPKSVPAGSTPSSAGGISEQGWVSIGTSTLASANLEAGDALVTVIQPIDGPKTRTQHDYNSDRVSILDFDGVDGTGVLDSTEGFLRAMSSDSYVLIPQGSVVSISPSMSDAFAGYLIVAGELRVLSDAVISSSIEITSGSIYVDSGKTLSLNGKYFSGPAKRFFFGAGNVYGLRDVIPEWWGAVSDGVTECAAALNAATNCITNSVSNFGLRPRVTLMSGRYLISSTWVINSSASVGVEILGQGIIFSGTRIIAASNFTGSQAVYIPSLADGTQRIVDFRLKDFAIIPQQVGSGPSFGLQIGTDNLMMNGLRESLIEGIYIENFGTSMRLLNARLVKLSRVGIWNDASPNASTNLLIQSVGKFSGDLSFENCQFVNNQSKAGSRAVHITSNGVFDPTGDRGYQVAGIRFTECIFYPADQTVYVAALGGAHVEDIFFHNCQWDGDSNSMIYAVSSGQGSQVNDIQVCNNYMYGGNKSTSDAQIQFVTGATGTMNNLRIDGNTLGNGTGRVVNTTTGSIPSITGLFINGNNIVDFSNANNPAIEIGSGCVRTQVSFNTATRMSPSFFPYLIQVDANADYYIISNNMGSGIASSATVNEVAPGAHRVVANNM